MDNEIRIKLYAVIMVFIFVNTLILIPPFLAIISFFIYEDIDLFFKIWGYGWLFALILCGLIDIYNSIKWRK